METKRIQLKKPLVVSLPLPVLEDLVTEAIKCGLTPNTLARQYIMAALEAK